MRIDWFIWNDWNLEHVARHGIHPDEVDEMLESPHRTIKTHSGRYILYGRSLTGRYLAAVYDPLGHGQGFVITARDMNDAERKRFRKFV